MRTSAAGILIGVVSVCTGGMAAPAADGPAIDLQTTAVRLLLGVTDKQPTPWDGRAKITAGRICRIDGWRFRPGDEVLGNGGWKSSSHILQTMQKKQAKMAAGGPVKMTAAGVVLTLAAPRDAQLEVETAQGSFRVSLAELARGQQVTALDGRVTADAAAPAVQITEGDTENDYPAAATAPDGTVWVAYVAHTHRGPATTDAIDQRPADFRDFVPAGGGDQVLLMRFDGKQWSAPVAISAPGGDLWRPAVAVDGQGYVHVVWSQNEEGNWDLFERVFNPSGSPQFLSPEPERLTTDPGADVAPALAVDKQGQVWVAWQKWHSVQAEICLMRLDVASTPVAPREVVSVTEGPGDKWSPAIAADAKGRLWVAYDSYAAGNYDVYLRSFSDGRLGPPIAVANSPCFEASSSVVCDSGDRVWVAYEQRGADWGKDTGPLAPVQGCPLYLYGSSVQVRVFDGDRLQQPPELMANFPGDVQRLNSYPRLALDGKGRVWLAFRHRLEAIWGNSPPYMMAGGVWLEYVTSLDGPQWTPPLLLACSDNLLDMRPALVRTVGGQLLAISSSDGRLRHEVEGSEQQRKIFFSGGGVSIPGQSKYDVFAAVLPDRPAAGEIALASVASDAPGPMGPPVDVPKFDRAASPADQLHSKLLHPESVADVQRIRSWVIEAGGKQYHPLRGEFHRHTEISMDGGSDGSLEDMWRYALDAADMDWIGDGDHDNGSGREYPWWIVQKTTDIYHVPGRFTPMFCYERSNQYPNGHRNAMFDHRGVRTLPRLRGDDPGGVSPDDAKMYYAYLREHGGICASHTSGTGMGTDWRDNDPLAEPIVEIYQGDRNSYEALGGPRVAHDAAVAIGGFKPLGMVWNALAMGYRLGFQSSSDHWSTHISYAVALAEEHTRPAILDAFRRRHCYAATDNIVLDVRIGEHIMGDDFTYRQEEMPTLTVHVRGTAPLASVEVVKNFKYVYAVEPKQAACDFTWTDRDAQRGQNWYYVRVLQTDTQVAWGSPIWLRIPGK